MFRTRSCSEQGQNKGGPVLESESLQGEKESSPWEPGRAPSLRTGWAGTLLLNSEVS